MITSHLADLAAVEQFAPFVPRLEAFVKGVLPDLTVEYEKEGFVLTHYGKGAVLTCRESPHSYLGAFVERQICTATTCWWTRRRVNGASRDSWIGNGPVLTPQVKSLWP